MKIKFYSLFFAVALLMTGCSKDFLESGPTEVVSNDQLGEADPMMLMRGVYSTMFINGSGGTGSGDINLSHMDYGQKGYDVFSDMLTGDMVLGAYNYNWYSDIAEHTSTVDFSADENSLVWRYYYRIIRSANTVLDVYGLENPTFESDRDKYIYGQAKAMRAYAYFYLANFFSEGYTASEPILPIVTNLKAEAQPLSTAKEVYDFIIKDLTEAINYLDGFNRSYRNQINQGVARGLLAYTYAATGNYTKVETITSTIISSGNFDLMKANQLVGGLDLDGDGQVSYTKGGFNSVETTDWMWGQNLTKANELDLVSWWGQMDVYTYSYASVGDMKQISTDLYNAIPANDIRKQQFADAIIDTTGLSQSEIDDIVADYPTFTYAINNKYLATNKFYAPTRKFQGERYITFDYIYMRVEEMYLLNAEAKAHLGDLPGAKASLKALLDIRMPAAGDADTYLNSLAGKQDVLDAVYLQTRIEFWGEGKSYLAMKRNEATVTLPSNHLTAQGTLIPYNDDRMSFDIPENEVLNNPKI